MTVLGVAQAGGHLEQLMLLVSRYRFVGERLEIVTTDPTATAVALDVDEVHQLPYPRPRDARAAARSLVAARRVIDRTGPRLVLSTGSLIAVPFLAEAARRSLPAVYIESVTRTEGPSLSGRLLERVPRVTRLSQHDWGRCRWRTTASILDEFEPDGEAEDVISSVFATVGGTKDYAFARFVERVKEIVPDDVELVVQAGPLADPADPRDVAYLAFSAFREHVEAADVVVSHAGVGVTVETLRTGKCPVLVPRHAEHGEHVDDHQMLLASRLVGSPVALVRSADELTWADLELAGRTRIRARSERLQETEVSGP